MTIVLGGKRIDTAPFGIESKCWLDDPRDAPPADPRDLSRRTAAIRTAIVHTTGGKRVRVRPGIRVSARAEAQARYQSTTKRRVSWDFTSDTDCTVVQHNDPCAFYTWAAHNPNPTSFSIELQQDEDGSLYEGQLEGTVLFLDFMTAVLPPPHAVQRQVPVDATGRPFRGRIERMDPGTAGRNFFGIGGHRNVWIHNEAKTALIAAKPEGDPGDPIFERLLAAGYEGYFPNPRGATEPGDRHEWKLRQQALGLTGADVDGVAGAKTRAALAKSGRRHGLWVPRPIDILIPDGWASID